MKIKLTEEQFDEYSKNLLLYGTAFLQYNYEKGEIVVKVLDNEKVQLKEKQDENFYSIISTAYNNWLRSVY